ncbi:MAG: hypothetical protein Kow0073_01690 [Immundisolibacter sp.]
MQDSRVFRIRHIPSGLTLAEGRRGWDITAFDGAYYIRRTCLRAGRWRLTPWPGLCPYKFFYLWLDWLLPDGQCERALGWRYVLPNPLLPFIAFRVAVPQHHPALEVIQHIAAETGLARAQ